MKVNDVDNESEVYGAGKVEGLIQNKVSTQSYLDLCHICLFIVN